MTKLEILHALKDGDVEFRHNLSKPRERPKQYYILIEINDSEYSLLAKIHPSYSEIVQIKRVLGNWILPITSIYFKDKLSLSW